MFVKKFARRNPDGSIHPDETWDPKLSLKELKKKKKELRAELLAHVPRDIKDSSYLYRLEGLVARTREVILCVFSHKTVRYLLCCTTSSVGILPLANL